ncbi:Unknown protein [Striga hermonthica]|uniref:Uncharacterized protein n=1 Tax=Striga hermonthica TaxID=68872 RepID=A0A9N7RDF0_STRHE|nr:Unknown protein [Striga hermonthica]
MSRSMLIILLLMVLVITSQFEWRQQFGSDMDTNPRDPQKQLTVSKREEEVKEKIILTQEKNIHRLNEAVLNLKEQLKKCVCYNVTSKNTLNSLAENVIGLEEEQIVDEFDQQEEIPVD